MGVVVRGAVAATLGVAIGMGGYEFGSAISQPAETNQGVQRCAQNLGALATTATTLPDACVDFSNHFTQRVTTVDVLTPDRAGTQSDTVVSKNVVYSLPSSADFLKDQLTSPTGAADQNTSNKVMGTILGIGGGIFMFFMLKNRREISSPKPTAEMSDL